VLLAGWSSNSKYSLIGSLRAVAQSISYESVLSTLLVLFLVLFLSFSVRSSSSLSSPLFLFLLPFWLLCTLAETHRAPFDFSESESELVSGFNTEYSGSYFAFIFLSEYSILLLSSMLMVFIFFSWFLSSFLGVLFYVLITLVIRYFFIWVRITFCRFRYDALMAFAWKRLLPTSLIFFSCFLSQF
jgi:NADH:ubiquinone oxidoreductase subunit H